MNNFLITGYYFKGNLGDDLLMKVASTIFPLNNTRIIGIDTINIYNTKYIDDIVKWTDKLILFGGEVINHFFLDKLLAIRTYALSKFNKFIPFYAIGVSCNCDYNEIVSKTDIFETIMFRNKKDYELFYSRFQKNNIFYISYQVGNSYSLDEFNRGKISRRPHKFRILDNSNRDSYDRKKYHYTKIKNNKNKNLIIAKLKSNNSNYHSWKVLNVDKIDIDDLAEDFTSSSKTRSYKVGRRLAKIKQEC